MVSKSSMDLCPSKVTSPEFDGDRSIINGEYLPITTTDQENSIPYTGPSLHTHSTNNTSFNHWRSPLLPTQFILCILFKYIWNPYFIISLRLTLATVCNRTSKVSWKLFLNIHEKLHLLPKE